MTMQKEVTRRPINSVKTKNAIDDKDTIRAAEFVIIFAPSGTGKSFTGDYMQVVHGYNHVDGIHKQMGYVPEYKDMFERLVLEGDADPFSGEQVRLTLEAAKDNDRVVFTFATPFNEQRNKFVDGLVEGGASEDRITLIQLTIDPTVRARGMYHRTKKQVEQAGTTLTDYCKSGAFMTIFEGETAEITEEIFVENMVKCYAIESRHFETHPNAITVDVSGRDASHFDAMDKALGLTRPGELTYESICAKVKPIDEARDKKAMDSGFAEIYGDIMSKAKPELLLTPKIAEEEEDVHQFEKKMNRRSSVIPLKKNLTSLFTRCTSDEVEVK